MVVKKYFEGKVWNIIKFNEMKTDKGHELKSMNGKDSLILKC